MFVVVVALFAALNVYRSTTLTVQTAASSSHEFSHRQGPRPQSAPGRQYLPADGRSTPRPEVDRLQSVRCVRDDDYPPLNATVDDDDVVRAVPLWQRRLRRRRPNASANAALEDDIVGPYYFLTELLQVNCRFVTSRRLL